jgi:hypothetical protein
MSDRLKEKGHLFREQARGPGWSNRHVDHFVERIGGYGRQVLGLPPRGLPD